MSSMRTWSTSLWRRLSTVAASSTRWGVAVPRSTLHRIDQLTPISSTITRKVGRKRTTHRSSGFTPSSGRDGKLLQIVCNANPWRPSTVTGEPGNDKKTRSTDSGSRSHQSTTWSRLLENGKCQANKTFKKFLKLSHLWSCLIEKSSIDQF